MLKRLNQSTSNHRILVEENKSNGQISPENAISFFTLELGARNPRHSRAVQFRGLLEANTFAHMTAKRQNYASIYTRASDSIFNVVTLHSGEYHHPAIFARQNFDV